MLECSGVGCRMPDWQNKCKPVQAMGIVRLSRVTNRVRHSNIRSNVWTSMIRHGHMPVRAPAVNPKSGVPTFRPCILISSLRSYNHKHDRNVQSFSHLQVPLGRLGVCFVLLEVHAHEARDIVNVLAPQQ